MADNAFEWARQRGKTYMCAMTKAEYAEISVDRFKRTVVEEGLSHDHGEQRHLPGHTTHAGLHRCLLRGTLQDVDASLVEAPPCSVRPLKMEGESPQEALPPPKLKPGRMCDMLKRPRVESNHQPLPLQYARILHTRR